jgi:tRNA(Ile)-lysidine synthase
MGSTRTPRRDPSGATATVSTSPRLPQERFRERWARLARAVGLAPDEPVVVALSGGADSVLLLHLVAAARPRPRVFAVHVDHGLRGAESEEDARFCARLAASLGTPFVRRRLALDPRPAGLEARAREARYAALAEEARRLGVRAIATGHHADDALETLLLRWTRGTPLGGLSGPRASRPLAFGPSPGRAADEARLVRPLLAMRREEVRRLLADHGLAWREDASNRSLAFARNRVRRRVLPALGRLGGEGALDNLLAFGRAVEAFEERLAAGTAHLAWEPPEHAAARLAAREATLGGSIARAALVALVPPLRRRALWRLVAEGTGRAPSRALLERLAEDLAAGACTRRSLPGGWSLWLRRERLHLCPPRDAREPGPALALPRPPVRQLPLPFLAGPLARRAPDLVPLELPGLALLPDGRAVLSELVDADPGAAPPRSAIEVQLDAGLLDARETLGLRLPRPGDRFHPLGAPGGRRLVRFLADLGVPREDRARIPLVVRGERGEEILWVAGLRPAHGWRVSAGTRRRLRLRLVDAAPAPPPRERAELFAARAR